MNKSKKIFLLTLLIICLSSILLIHDLSKKSFFDNLLSYIEDKKQSKLVEYYELDDNIRYSIDNFQYNKYNNIITVRGWANIYKLNSQNCKILILLQSDKNWYIYNSETESRQDVTDHFKDGVNYNNSGFNAVISLYKIKEGSYSLKILLQNEGKMFIRDTNYQVVYKKSDVRIINNTK